METVRSADGTTIAFDRSGDGPPLVMVLGAFNDRHTKAPLGALLAVDFTVYSYDRRGRGDSGDAPPYAVEREIEDLAAVLDAAGGRARVFGHSSGAVLALAAAAEGLSVDKLALFDPPIALGDEAEAEVVPGDLLDRVRAEVDGGRPGEAAKLFLREAVGMPPPVVAMIESSPHWPGMEALAPTLPYDLAITSIALPRDRLAAIEAPTLAVVGESSPAFMHATAHALAGAIPDAKQVTLPGQDHDEDPDALAPVLREFLA